MKTTISLKQIKNYVLIAVTTGLLFSVFKVLFALVGYIQFFVGVAQVFIALLKTIMIYAKHRSVPLPLKHYWITVGIYFVIMALGGFVINWLNCSNDILSTIGLFYLGLAWGIAVYHFKHILFLKIN